MLLVLERFNSVIFVIIFISYYPVQLPFQKCFVVFINTEEKKNRQTLTFFQLCLLWSLTAWRRMLPGSTQGAWNCCNIITAVKLLLKILLFAVSKHTMLSWCNCTLKINCVTNSLIYFQWAKSSIFNICIGPIYLFLQRKK